MPIPNEAVDIFGGASDLPPEMGGAGAPEEEEEEGEEGKEGDDKDDKKGGKEGEGDDGEDDEDEDDEIDLEKETDPEKLRKAALRFKDSSKLKSESIKNLRRSRREGRIQSQQGQGGTFEAPWKGEDVTYSKDLSKELRDKMTDNERKLHDDLVKVREQLNTDAKGRFDADEAKKKEGFNPDVVLDDEIEDLAKEESLVLAKGDRRKANEIIKHFNKFDNKGLTEAQLVERLSDAAKLAGGVTVPKDQESRGKGKPVKKSAADPYGVNAIVDSVASTGVKQTYSL